MFNGRRVVAYGFFPNCHQALLKAEVDGIEISTVVSCTELSITRGDLIHKLTAKSLIDDWQYGVLNEKDQVKNSLYYAKLKQKVIELSKQYSITSEYTSFLAIEDRDQNEKKQQSTTPKINELLSIDQDASSIDFLPYMQFEAKKFGLQKPELKDDNELAVLTGDFNFDFDRFLNSFDLKSSDSIDR